MLHPNMIRSNHSASLWQSLRLLFFAGLFLLPLSLWGYVTISGPTTVVGGGSATYEYEEDCSGWDACYGYVTSWAVTGGTITSNPSNPYFCTVDWDLSGGTHRLTASFTYNYMMYGNWYTDYNSIQVNVNTTYTYSKTTVGNYTIDSTDLSDKNYIHTITPSSEYTTLPYCRETRSPDIHESFSVIDGLGRAIQSVSLRSTYTGEDVFQHVVFDDFGRESTKYLPFPNDRDYYDDLYLSNLSAQILYYYGANNDPYSKTVYDGSPLNRVLEQGGVGDDWQPTDGSGSSNGHTQKFEYLTNYATDYVRVWDVSHDTVCSSNSCYAEGELVVNLVIDENDGESLEYKDYMGRVILKEIVLSASESLRTYYIYDDYDLLRFVLPPRYVADHVPSGSTSTSFDQTNANFKKYGYFYKYDKRKRVIEKQLPGADAIHMVYDKRDRLVASQDGEARENNQWLISKYDILNRPVMTGVLSSSSSRASLQGMVDAYTGDSLYEARSGAGGNIHEYTNQSFPLSLAESDYLTVTYYDSYEDFPTGYTDGGYTTAAITGLTNISSSDFDQTKSVSHARGQVSGGKTKNLDSGSWYMAVNYYDRKGRLIQTKVQNHLGGYDRVSSAYNFANNVTKTFHEHQSSYDTICMGERFVYDHGGRLLENYHQVSGQGELLMAAMKYNPEGEMEDKYLYSTETTTSKGMLQRVDYDYNIRGWLTSINDPDNLDSDWFAMELMYNDVSEVSASLNTEENYNGNIAATVWSNQNNTTTWGERGYSYFYDAANRITKGDYGDYQNWGTTDYDVSNITYDENGNIKSLTRRDDTQVLDSLEYFYIGNQLDGVTEAGDQSDGFVYSGSPFPYAYDKNGNLKYDLNKGMDTIYYNYLNLPSKLAFQSTTDQIEYIYDAGGNKLQKKVRASGSTSTTDYVGSVIYVDGELAFVLSSEGRLIPSGNDYLYEYHLKDHLGNTRAAFEVNTSGVMNLRQLTDYYPFGMTRTLYESSIDNNFLYNGKELQEELGLDWYDYGARFYDPALGRWHVVDPMTEKYSSLSPYEYVGGNPIIRIDPDGMDWYDMSDDDNPDIQWADGSEDQLKPGLLNQIKDLWGAGEYSESLGEEVLVISGVEDDEEVNEATFDFYSSGNTEEASASMTGSSIPSDVNNMNTMEEGLYTETFLIEDYHGSGINAIGFDEGTVDPTDGGDPMTYVRVHRGNIFNDGGRYDSNDNAWSQGCPTFGYGANLSEDATSFGDNFTDNTNVYLKRH